MRNINCPDLWLSLVAHRYIPVICQPFSVRRPFFSSIANLYLVPANFLFLLLSCLNFILNYFFLSYFGLFELLSFILNWLFLVSQQQSVGAASLAVIITQFYAGKFDCCFIMIWLLALDAGAAYCRPLPMPSSPSSARS